MTQNVVRFAPSPTGYLHVGNLRTAIINWLFVCKTSGQFVLRLDDTDVARSREEYVAGIRHDLAWLGIRVDREERQSARLDRYNNVMQTLEAKGFVYPCWETAEELDIKRKIQLSRGLPPIYDRAALNLSFADRERLLADGIAPHWRFRLDTTKRTSVEDLVQGHVEMDPASLSDPVVRRADGSYLYMLPSVIDDIDMGITHVVRGQDHMTNSIIQAQMFAALGAPFPQFAHLALLSTKEQELSKRLGSAGVEHYQKLGIEPIALFAYLGRLGTSDPIEPVAHIAPLVERFAWGKFNKANTLFDEAELVALNTKILHHSSYEQVHSSVPATMTPERWAVIGPNITSLKDVPHWMDIIDGPMSPVIADRDFIGQAKAALQALDWGEDIWKRWTEALKAATGRKGKELFMPLRLALTGEAHGPDMNALVPLIGRERVLERLG